MNNKKYLFLSLTLPLLAMIFLGFGFYLYDPFSLYHKQKTLSSNVRMQAKGIIKHYDFDSYIIGTSELGNTSAKEAGEKLGGKWVNLSLAGSSLQERDLMLDYAFYKKSVSSVILSFDGLNQENYIPAYLKFLYDKQEWNDLRVYFDSKILKCMLFGSNSSCKKTVNNIESLAQFGRDEKTKARFGGLQNWFVGNYRKVSQLGEVAFAIKNDGFAKLKPMEIKDIHKGQENLEKYVLKFIKNYPQTNFYLIIPPYSRLKYNIYRFRPNEATNSEMFYTWSAIIKWLVSELEKYPNATLYGFDTLEYADEIANYSDLIHYNIDMNSMQLDAIANKKHILTSQNIEEYLKIMEEKIQAYDVETVIESVKDKL